MTDTIAAEAARRARAVSMQRFNTLCLRAHNLLKQAATIAINAGLGDVHVEKARAAAGLAGAMFYTIAGRADSVDFQRLRDDLELVRDKVDPLIAAIGTEARINTTSASKDAFDECFQQVIGVAIDGNALFLLDQAAEVASEPPERNPDHWRDQRRDDEMMGTR